MADAAGAGGKRSIDLHMTELVTGEGRRKRKDQARVLREQAPVIDAIVAQVVVPRRGRASGAPRRAGRRFAAAADSGMSRAPPRLAGGRGLQGGLGGPLCAS